MPVNAEEHKKPENAVKVESAQSPPKKKVGGKRPGAGRKPNPARILLKGVKRDTLSLACRDINIGDVVRGLLHSKREVIRLQTLNFLFDRIRGKPKQDVTLSGGFIHAHTRDPLLAAMPKEALEELARSYDQTLAKYALPAAPASATDSPQNQAQSDMVGDDDRPA
jgi:hypothetical protein